MAWTPDYNVLALIVAGDLGDRTIWTDRYGRKVWSNKNWPDKPPSPLQQEQRRRWRLACDRWQGLTREDRAAWENLSKAAYCSCTGYNLYMHASLTPDQSRIDTLEQQTGLTVNRPEYIPQEDPRDGQFF